MYTGNSAYWEICIMEKIHTRKMHLEKYAYREICILLNMHIEKYAYREQNMHIGKYAY